MPPKRQAMRTCRCRAGQRQTATSSAVAAVRGAGHLARCTRCLAGCWRRRGSSAAMGCCSWWCRCPMGRRARSRWPRPTSWATKPVAELATGAFGGGDPRAAGAGRLAEAVTAVPGSGPRRANRLDRPCTRQRTREVSLFAKAQDSRAHPADPGHSGVAHDTAASGGGRCRKTAQEAVVCVLARMIAARRRRRGGGGRR